MICHIPAQPTLCPERTVTVTNHNKFKTLWRRDRSRLRSVCKRKIDPNFKIKEILDVMSECKSLASETKRIKRDIGSEAFKVSDISVSAYPVKDFYKKVRRYFKGSLFQESSDVRADPQFRDVLKRKFDKLIIPQLEFEAFGGECQLPQMTKNECESIINSLSNSSCNDLFGINPKDLKAIAQDLAPMITGLFNEMLVTRTFPSLISKNTRCFGLWKGKKDRESPVNFRPLCIAVWIGKCLHKGFLSRVLKLNIFIHPNQHAYQPGKCTASALLQLYSVVLHDHIYLVFCDYAGCFEAVSHQPLISEFSKSSQQAADILKSMISTNVMNFTLGEKSAIILKNRQGKSVEQGGNCSPFNYNVFDSQIILEFEKRLAALGITGVVVIGYSDDHVICCKRFEDCSIAFQTFEQVTREFGILLEPTKTELVCPNPASNLELETRSGKTVCVVKSKQFVRWLGFNLSFKNGKLHLNLGALSKLHSYVREINAHVDNTTFTTVYRLYVQSSLNYMYIACERFGGTCKQDFQYWENKFRDIRKSSQITALPLTSAICKSQLEFLNQQYPL